MNNVLKDSLFGKPKAGNLMKFNLLSGSFRQSMSVILLSKIIFLLLYRTMQERKKLHWNCFVFQFMMMNYGH